LAWRGRRTGAASVPDTEDAQKSGAEHFQHHCQICHGLDGQNTGVPFAEKMSPPVANLAAKDIQDYTDGQLKWIIENGIRHTGMPAWKGILEDDEMWAHRSVHPSSASQGSVRLTLSFQGRKREAPT